MNCALFLWISLFCGAASLQFVFSMGKEESIQNLDEVESNSDLQEDEQSPLQKRNLLQFAHMVYCATKRNPLDYNKYGNWCGVGGQGEPVDGIDRCCQSHDMCYSRNHDCNPKWLTYKYRTRRQTSDACSITCEDKRGSCGRSLCECDREAARCFARNHYNPKHHSWFR